MERPPQFIRDFSKEAAPEERQRVAQAIRSTRAEHFTGRRLEKERSGELQSSTGERERALGEQLAAIRQLERQLTELSTSGLGRIRHYFRLRKLRADLAIGEKTYAELELHQRTEIAERDALSARLQPDQMPPATQIAHKLLASFYDGQKEAWAHSEYTKDDIARLFSEEHLALLGLEDYSLLLRRFPQEMVAHVTRQGIRDHTGHLWHTGGAGAYAVSFMKMISDGRLRSPLGIALVEEEKEQAVARMLRLDDFATKTEALESLAIIADPDQGSQGSYVDRMAVHFATEEVADVYYGSEKGNEIFIAYPSAYIASQYYFNGQLTKGGGGYWNDQWVWANEEKGMDLNAGIIFIPADARVDRTTGSRYQLDSSQKPIRNIGYHDAFLRVYQAPDFQNFAQQASAISGKLKQRWDDRDLAEENQTVLEELEPFRRRLEQEFGISDRRLQMAILKHRNLIDLTLGQPADETIDNALQDAGILYFEAQDTTSSQEFWEAYFATQPASRPSKVVYYEGGNPTRALRAWRNKERIYKRAETPDFGFTDRSIPRDAPEATAGLDRFRSLAEEIIDNHFAQAAAGS